MASQWPNIHFTTRVDMPEPVSQSLVREADFTDKWKSPSLEITEHCGVSRYQP